MLLSTTVVSEPVSKYVPPGPSHWNNTSPVSPAGSVAEQVMDAKSPMSTSEEGVAERLTLKGSVIARSIYKIAQSLMELRMR